MSVTPGLRRQPPQNPAPEATAVEPESGEGTAAEPPGEETAAEPPGEELVVEDLLVEDVSIDGMCGVY